MNYKITTGLFATTTLIFAIAFGVTFGMLQKQPDMRDGFPGGGFPGGDFAEGEFGMPPFGEGEFPGANFCECPSVEDEEIEAEDEEVSTEDTEEAL